MMQELTRPPTKYQEQERRGTDTKGFVVANAPWDNIPDTASTEEFPSFGTVVAPKSNTAWGPLRSGKR